MNPVILLAASSQKSREKCSSRFTIDGQLHEPNIVKKRIRQRINKSQRNRLLLVVFFQSYIINRQFIEEKKANK